MRKLLVLLTSGLVLTNLCGCGINEIDSNELKTMNIDYELLGDYVEKEFDDVELFDILDSNENTITFKIYREDGPSDIIEIGRN